MKIHSTANWLFIKSIIIRLNNVVLAAISTLMLCGSLTAQPLIQWIRFYVQEGASFRDVFVCDNGDYVTVGKIDLDVQQGNRNLQRVLMMRITPEGELIWQQNFHLFQDCSFEVGQNIIETDNGNFLIGGGVENAQREVWFMAAKISTDGEVIWARKYGNPIRGFCWATIETKSGNFLLGGRVEYDQALYMVNSNGEVVWNARYGIPDGGEREADERISAIREVQGDGYYLAGVYNGHASLTKITGPDGIVWRQLYRPQNGVFRLPNLVTVADRFYLGGYTQVQNDSVSYWPSLFLVDREGNPIWQRSYYTGFEWNCQSIIKTPDNGVIFVGQTESDQGYCGFAFKVDHAGDSCWYHLAERVSSFTSIVIDQNDFPVACGAFAENAFLYKLAPDVSGPVIIWKRPPEERVKVLLSENVRFSIGAFDYQDDQLFYYWLFDGDTISHSPERDSVIIRSFQNYGDYFLKCVVSDGVQADSASWQIAIMDMYIKGYSPDSTGLIVRRGRSVEFSLDTVRAVEGDPVEYQWTLTNLDNFEREDAGGDAGVTVEFLRSGNYQMEGLAYRGESSDNVIWTISVRSAILDFWPHELNLSVLPDSLATFYVLPFNPESDSLNYRWELDGDSVGSDSTVTLRFAWDDRRIGNPPHLVSAIVMDGVEGDTIRWEVTVQDPNAPPPTPPSIEGGENPTTFGITSVSPNPFNSTTTIRYSTSGDAYPTRLTVHDLTGREVIRLMDERAQQSPPSRGGPYAVTLDGRDLPAGVYLLRLSVHDYTATQKIVLLR